MNAPTVGTMSLRERDWYIGVLDLRDEDKILELCRKRATAFLLRSSRGRWTKLVCWAQPSWVSKFCNSDISTASKRLRDALKRTRVQEVRRVDVVPHSKLGSKKANDVTAYCTLASGSSVIIYFRMLFEKTSDDNAGNWYVAPLSLSIRCE